MSFVRNVECAYPKGKRKAKERKYADLFFKIRGNAGINRSHCRRLKMTRNFNEADRWVNHLGKQYDNQEKNV
jgi:hypothetical protein